MSAKCPLCHQPIALEQGPVVFGEDGLPEALSLVEGFGLPVVEAISARNLAIFLDGAEVDGAVAFDRRAGIIWRVQRDAAGHYMRRDGFYLYEKVPGRVEVTKRIDGTLQ